jgi:solute carrier family 8 (sodium/calcium exchanger)
LIFSKNLAGDDGGDDDEPPNPDDEPPTPSCMDYIMHFLTVFWKIIFAFIPPTGE